VYNIAAGHHVEILTPPIADGNSTSQSHKMKKPRPPATLRRILDDASSGEEDTASGWRQSSPESEVFSIDDTPQVYHQDISADKDDGWIGSRQQNAAEEYRNVMTMLRNKDQVNKVPASLSGLVGVFWVLLNRTFPYFVRSSEGSYVLALIFYSFRLGWPAMGTKKQKLSSVPEFMLNSCIGSYYNYCNSFAVFFPIFCGLYEPSVS
jgi:hypothetical protein